MIAFEISLNSQVFAVVGARDLIGLTATVMACIELNESIIAPFEEPAIIAKTA
jgi:hypothetical protein